MEKTALRFVTIALISIILAGCAGISYGPTPGGNGRAVFTITDKAVNMSAVTSINVTVDSVQVHSATKGWITVSSTPKTYNLLQLNATGIQLLLADAQLEPGNYEQVRLEISKVVVSDAQGQHEAKLPSGNLKIVGGFEVKTNSTSVVIFDFDADKSLHVTGNGKYILAPVVHLQTKENAEVEVNERNEVQIRRGDLKTDVKVGMDENGSVAVGFKIPADANLTIDVNGVIKVNKGEGAQQGGHGRLVVTIGDAAANLSSISSINVTISSVEVHSSTNGWVTINSTPKTFNLLQLRASGLKDLLADVQLEPGHYEQIRLNISSVVVTDSNGTHVAKLPSGELKIVGQFDVKSNSTSTAELDVLANESLHLTGNGQYILAPVIRLDTKEDANVEIMNDSDVRVNRGNVMTHAKVGMDENGTVGENKSIPVDVNVTVDTNGHVHITGRGH
jgi:hypothetical protein